MPNTQSSPTTAQTGSPGGSRARIDYRIEGRILRTTAVGPFHDELVSAIPPGIKVLLVKLIQQGKWGQIVTFERNAVTSSVALAEFTEYLKRRYVNPDTRPVTALVFGQNIEGAEAMAPLFQQCYQGAGIDCQVFEDYSTAHYWVKSRIRQTSRLVEWNDSYKIGEASIDEQHQELFMRAADIIAAVNHESQMLSALRLYQYTRTHFSHEEELMRRGNYPDIAAHLLQHETLLRQLQLFLQHITRDTLVKDELEDFIAQWFLGHIANSDQKLASFLKAG
ncbi:MAG: hemerythrin family protein [Rhodoferax sp.]|jgi:hemerythrin|uniref:bacteriohemerythrin n=1 Tax=Rhodoferax sp. TaxID=50421 RepID=UPI001B503DE7|nr:hemerythrin family protein [Rhodoferax sp.]MBP8287182.1 hemerythrin family protein [Rhodoferax sp.]MBP9150333.1 hemerythrin family protein [Rhodoferax sp.]MBP9737254.1 hemerythrin family protein [Rhodoferax sp.]